jgi:hypothetical protein
MWDLLRWLLYIVVALGGAAHAFPKALLGSNSILTKTIKLGPVPLSLQRIAGFVTLGLAVWLAFFA